MAKIENNNKINNRFYPFIYNTIYPFLFYKLYKYTMLILLILNHLKDIYKDLLNRQRKVV